MKEIKISKKMMVTMGSHSLSGHLLMLGLIPTAEPIKVLFQESTREWKEKHGGADEIIIPEYVPACLCEDVIHLTEQGIKLEIGYYPED